MALSSAIPGAAWATTEDSHLREPRLPSFGRFSFQERRRGLEPREAFERARAILEHFGVPPEEDTQASLADLQGAQTSSGLALALPFLDRDGAFARYSAVQDGARLSVFQDPGSRTSPDFTVTLASEGSAPPVSVFVERLRLAAASATAERPLAGLRIAIDPGHMGGEPWDERAGKFVKDGKGNLLSEGLLVLQLGLLLEQELTALGAEVMLTRRGLTPVTTLPYETFELKPFAEVELRESVDDEWFQSLLPTAQAGPRLFRAFAANASFRKIFSEQMRWKYFFLGEDLDARVRAIRAFAPDITLALHLDVGPRGVNATKVYVPGGFFADEFATREQRRDFAWHLLDGPAWQASVSLSRAIVSQMSLRLGIPMETSGLGNSVPVEPGVFARNLAVQRRITGSAVAYLECLHYSDPAEFSRLRQYTRSMEIEGRQYGYSERLVQLAEAVRDGVVSFAASDHR
ncbi:MAG: N-acetylmuramoyl-L-alanine amidase [Oligoflexia bacterium]|nr:N-acetylmuramoyl-L-alanine amidase [Oligoflexia bacterium]